MQKVIISSVLGIFLGFFCCRVMAASNLQKAPVMTPASQPICPLMLGSCQIWEVVPQGIIPATNKQGKPVLHVNFWWGTTQVRYHDYLGRLCNALVRLGAKEAPFKDEYAKDNISVQFCATPNAPGNEFGDRFHPGKGWVHFWLPKKMLNTEDEFNQELSQFGYKITVEFLDDKGEVVRTEIVAVEFYAYNALPFPRARYGLKLNPLYSDVRKKACYQRPFHLTFENFSTPEEFARFKQVRARLEVVRKDQEPHLKFQQNTVKWEWVSP